jgi:hypothetical protein
MTEFTVQFPLVVKLDDAPGDAWPHEVGYMDISGTYHRLDSADDYQLKEMGIVKPTPALRRGDVLRRRADGWHSIVHDVNHAFGWEQMHDLVGHFDLDAEVQR